MKYPTITREQVAELLRTGHKLTPAGLYEPDHTPKGTKFVVVEKRGLHRIRPPKEGKKS